MKIDNCFGNKIPTFGVVYRKNISDYHTQRDDTNEMYFFSATILLASSLSKLYRVGIVTTISSISISGGLGGGFENVLPVFLKALIATLLSPPPDRSVGQKCTRRQRAPFQTRLPEEARQSDHNQR